MFGMKARDSVAISLSPTVGGEGGYRGEAAGGSNLKPSNWKRWICNKWEMTGYCPFGSKCHFAHGAAELHRCGGGLVDMDGRDAASAAADHSRQAGSSSRAHTDAIAASNTWVPHPDTHHTGVPAQRTTAVSQRQQGQRPRKWKGPDKISKIYGDWIDDLD